VELDASLTKIDEEVKHLSAKKGPQAQDDEYKPQSFTKVQDVVKPEVAGIRADPADIDGEKEKQNSANASAMVKDLDGMTKYLQGVRVPGALQNQGAHLSYTLKGMRNDDRINQLYNMAPMPAQK
jgi:hypothetical protein